MCGNWLLIKTWTHQRIEIAGQITTLYFGEKLIQKDMAEFCSAAEAAEATNRWEYLQFRKYLEVEFEPAC